MRPAAPRREDRRGRGGGSDRLGACGLLRRLRRRRMRDRASGSFGSSLDRSPRRSRSRVVLIGRRRRGSVGFGRSTADGHRPRQAGGFLTGFPLGLLRAFLAIGFLLIGAEGLLAVVFAVECPKRSGSVSTTPGPGVCPVGSASSCPPRVGFTQTMGVADGTVRFRVGGRDRPAESAEERARRRSRRGTRPSALVSLCRSPAARGDSPQLSLYCDDRLIVRSAASRFLQKSHQPPSRGFAAARTASVIVSTSELSSFQHCQNSGTSRCTSDIRTNDPSAS